MQRIYQAANNIEAHMIVHLLGQTGIRAHVEGEHLQSGAGELPLGGLVAVSVDDENAEAARTIVLEWEARSSSADSLPPARTQASSQVAVLTFFIGALLGGAIVWSAYNGPPNASNAGCNNDGKIDQPWSPTRG
jgi:hypothetical protein